MQERIIEIIVNLLSEMQQERKHKDKVDLTHDLMLKGYTEIEINLAFTWIFGHLKQAAPDNMNDIVELPLEIDDFPEIDKLVISPDAYGFLIQLIQLGVIKDIELEIFVERALAYGKDDLNVDDLKSIVASILFDLDNRSTFDGYTFYGGDMTIQ
jgi:uncharacterized protein Smg (DUF494 family)